LTGGTGTAYYDDAVVVDFLASPGYFNYPTDPPLDAAMVRTAVDQLMEANRTGPPGCDLRIPPEPPRPAHHRGGGRVPTEEDVIAHLEHALQVCGEDHVGIGGDLSVTPIDMSDAYWSAHREFVRRRIEGGIAAPEEDRTSCSRSPT